MAAFLSFCWNCSLRALNLADMGLSRGESLLSSLRGDVGGDVMMTSLPRGDVMTSLPRGDVGVTTSFVTSCSGCEARSVMPVCGGEGRGWVEGGDGDCVCDDVSLSVCAWEEEAGGGRSLVDDGVLRGDVAGLGSESGFPEARDDIR